MSHEETVDVKEELGEIDNKLEEARGEHLNAISNNEPFEGYVKLIDVKPVDYTYSEVEKVINVEVIGLKQLNRCMV